MACWVACSARKAVAAANQHAVAKPLVATVAVLLELADVPQHLAVTVAVQLVDVPADVAVLRHQAAAANRLLHAVARRRAVA